MKYLQIRQRFLPINRVRMFKFLNEVLDKVDTIEIDNCS